jgi:hypothetical protein
MSQFARMVSQGRFCGLDTGDWFVILGGAAFVVLVALLV